MNIIENSIVLRTGKFRENDLWVKILTANHGVITVFAFGASRSRRRFTGCLDSYNLILSRINSSKNGQFLNLQEASLLESYTSIRVDWKKQGFVANCIRFLEALGVSPLDADKVFVLTRTLLQFINETDIIHPMIPLLFRFRIAMEYGYSVNVEHCYKCKANFKENIHSFNGAFFLVSEGYFVCRTCKPKGFMSLYASNDSLDILTNIQDYSPMYWGGYVVSPEIWREVGRVIDALVRYHLGLEWAEGHFRKSY